MGKGAQFLKSQVTSAVVQHGAFLSALEAHEDQAEDDRFRDLCFRHIPQMREHQRALEEYKSQLGADAGTGRHILEAVLGAARDLADSARESDFAWLVADIAMARQVQDTFKTFREAGKMMGYETLPRDRRHRGAAPRRVREGGEQARSAHVRGARARGRSHCAPFNRL
ncbi:MAG: hypothetical protein M3037_04150 [Gemmatimonadota bacterium]|nr:hypothetical protein [Gemmatimonadota bacterium]